MQPVTIRYRPRPGLPASFYGWWGEMEFASHIRDVLARSTGGVVEVTFHPPLRAAEFPSRKVLADRAGAVVAGGFGAGAAHSVAEWVKSLIFIVICYGIHLS